MLSIEGLVGAWNAFFHTPELPTTIGVFRILWGTLLLLNALLLWKDATFFFGPTGLLPTKQFDLEYGRGRLTLFRFLPRTNASVHLIFFIHVVAALAMTLGFGTRISTVVTWLTLVSIHHRNPAMFHSGDTLLRLMTFLLMFSRAGQAYSLDSFWAGAMGEPSSPWCERLMQIQVAIVYLRTAYWKLQGKPWRNGTAAYYPLQVRCYTRFPLPRILQNRICIYFATWTTLAIESAFGILVWFKELRYPTLVAGICLHLGLEYVLNIQLFGWIMMTSFVIFIPPTDMEWFIHVLLLRQR